MNKKTIHAATVSSVLGILEPNVMQLMWYAVVVRSIGCLKQGAIYIHAFCLSVLFRTEHAGVEKAACLRSRAGRGGEDSCVCRRTKLGLVNSNM